MTTLVTGATGFVGSAVVRRLLSAGHAVRVLAREGSNRANLAGLEVDVVIGDLRDRHSLDVAVAGCDALFHVAADYRLWVRRPGDLYAANVDGSVNMVLAAANAGVRRMVYTSSVATLGVRADGRPADEDTPVSLDDMIGHYKRSKFLAEAKLLELVERERLPVVIVNPSAPIGPRDIKPTPTWRVIVRAAAGRMPAFVDTGLNLVHVDDVADGHMLAFERGEIGDRYILGGENWTLQRILEVVSCMTRRSPPRIRLPYYAVLPFAYLAEAWGHLRASEREPLVCVDSLRMSRKLMFFSSDKARRLLGYDPRPVTQALQEAIAWFKARNYC